MRAVRKTPEYREWLACYESSDRRKQRKKQTSDAWYQEHKDQLNAAKPWLKPEKRTYNTAFMRHYSATNECYRELKREGEVRRYTERYGSYNAGIAARWQHYIDAHPEKVAEWRARAEAKDIEIFGSVAAAASFRWQQWEALNPDYRRICNAFSLDARTFGGDGPERYEHIGGLKDNAPFESIADNDLISDAMSRLTDFERSVILEFAETLNFDDAACSLGMKVTDVQEIVASVQQKMTKEAFV